MGHTREVTSVSARVVLIGFDSRDLLPVGVNRSAKRRRGSALEPSAITGETTLRDGEPIPLVEL